MDVSSENCPTDENETTPSNSQERLPPPNLQSDPALTQTRSQTTFPLVLHIKVEPCEPNKSLNGGDKDYHECEKGVQVDIPSSDEDEPDHSSDEDEQDHSSDEDFVPSEEEEEISQASKPSVKRIRGPSKETCNPLESNKECIPTNGSHGEIKCEVVSLKEGMSTFRKKLVSSISLHNSITTSIELPRSCRDPRKKHAIIHNFDQDTFHLGSIEIICLDKERRLQCSNCKLIFGPNPKLSEKPQDLIFDHILAKHLHAYKCQHCKFSAQTYRSYKQHQTKKHPQSKVHVPCDICGKRIIANGMRRHKWVHMSEAEKKDPKNKGVIPFPKKHPELYNSRRYKCTTCGTSFKARFQLKYHENLHQPPEERKDTMVCPNCNLVLLKKSYPSHMKNKCTRRDKTCRQCPICKETLKNVKTLHSHLHKDHPKEKAYSCEICSKRFKIKPELKNHMHAHSDERKHICQLCGARFKEKKNLNRHEKACKEKMGIRQ